MKIHRLFPRGLLTVRNWLLCVCLAALNFQWPTPALAATDYATPYTFTTIAGSAGRGSADGTGGGAQFYDPAGSVMDGSGNLYLTDTGNNTIRKMTLDGTNWLITTVAGMAQNSGTNDGTGSNARFSGPIGIAMNTNGDLIVADANNHAIRMVTPQGVVTTLAGTPGTSGTNDTAPGVPGQFDQPYGVALDNAGNVYVADTGNGRIREVTPAGVVTTLAGLVNNSDDVNGTNTTARFDGPIGVALDAAGNIYVADEDGNTIRRVSPVGPNWVVTTLAGKTNTVGTADGTNSTARFSAPVGITVDGGTNLYVVDYGDDLVRRVSPVGTNWVVKTLAGKTNTVGMADGTNSNARFNTPVGVMVDRATNLYVADFGNSLVRKVTPEGTNWVVNTLAGRAGGAGTNNGAGSVAQFNGPTGLAFDVEGNLYVADVQNDAIRKITPGGGSWVVTNLAGLDGTSGSLNGTGTGARFSSPSGVAVDAGGNVYVADEENDLIRKVTPAGVVTTVAGLANTAGTNNGTGATARFSRPFGIAVDAATNLYVADTGNGSIRKVTPAGVVTTLAGLTNFDGNVDGTNSSARFYNPICIVVDSATNLYVADYYNLCIRKVSPVGTNWVTTTLAGQSGVPQDDDGTNTAALFDYPAAIALDGAGDLFVAESQGDTIRKMTPQGPDWVVTTVAGTPGGAGDLDGTGAAARFSQPFGLAIDGAGNLYVADGANNTIRKGSPATTVPSPALAFPNPAAGQFAFGITGTPGLALDVETSDDLLQWQVVGTGYILYGGTNYYIDPTPPTGNLFYRAHVR